MKLHKCDGRDILQDVEIRAHMAHHIPDKSRGSACDRPLHRRLLQPDPAPFGTRLYQPRKVRKAGDKLTKMLSTKVKQVQGRWIGIGVWYDTGAKTGVDAGSI